MIIISMSVDRERKRERHFCEDTDRRHLKCDRDTDQVESSDHVKLIMNTGHYSTLHTHKQENIQIIIINRG